MPTTSRSTHLARSLAVSLAVAALAAPAASARPAYDAPFSPRDSGPATTAVEPAAASTAATPVSSPPVVRSSGSGFDWGAAAVGAGAVSGIALLGLGGAMTRQRTHDGMHPAG